MYGGNLVVKNTRLTWVVLILVRIDYKRMTSCSGSIIHPSWVLTAGHCLIFNGVIASPEDIDMYAYHGTNNYSDLPIDAVYIHPKLLHESDITDDRLFSDVGMLRTTYDTRIGIGRLHKGSESYPQKPCELAGFGKKGPFNEEFPTLHTMEVTALPERTCGHITSYGICLLVLDGVGPCKGDSGSPMICDGKIVGVLSSGRTEATPVCDSTDVGVLFYEPVSEHLGWIEAVQEANQRMFPLNSQGTRSASPLLYLLLLLLCLL